MHKAFFTRFATAGIAVAPLTLVSALIWIDGSHAGQTSGQRGLAVAPETTAQTGTLTKPRPVPPLRPADPTLDSIGYSAEALVFGHASDPDATPAPTRSAITPTGLRGRQDGSTEPGHADQWAADGLGDESGDLGCKVHGPRIRRPGEGGQSGRGRANGVPAWRIPAGGLSCPP